MYHSPKHLSLCICLAVLVSCIAGISMAGNSADTEKSKPEFHNFPDHSSGVSPEDAQPFSLNGIDGMLTGENTGEREDPILVEYVGSELWTAIIGVVVYGSYAYCLSQHGLLIIDVSDPSNPTLISKLYLQGNSAVHCHGLDFFPFFVFAANGSSGLRIIDVFNPSSPTLMGTCDTPGEAADVAVSGSYAYVADRSSGLQIIDFSNPYAPTIVGSYDTPNDAEGVAVSGNYAYVADVSYTDFLVIDISDPSSPSLAGSFDIDPGAARDIVIRDDYAFVAARNGLRIIDISNPTSPNLTGSCDTPGWANGLAISGNYAYMADHEDGLQIIDISDLSSPTLVGGHDTPHLAWNVAVSGNYAFVADYRSGLQVIDVSTPSSPTQAGSYDTPGDINGIAVSGIYAFVTDWTNGLNVLNIANPAAPALVGNCSTPGHSIDLTVSGNHAYIADGPSGLQIIDISVPSAPNLIGGYVTPDYAYDVAISGNHAFVASGGGGLVTIDITNPASPSPMGSYASLGMVQGIDVSWNYAYLASDYWGLEIVDISDPYNPTFVAGIEFDIAMDVAVSGDYAYLANDFGLRIVNIANPIAPFYVGYVPSQPLSSAWAVDISGDHAFMASGSGGLQVVDIFYPPMAAAVGSYDTPWDSRDVAVSGNYVYLTDGYAFMILRYETNCGAEDSDGDGVHDLCDNCPDNNNPDQEDFDGDRVGDICDNCMQAFNPDQADADGDSVGNACVVCPAVPGDIDNSGTVDHDDFSLLFEFVFNTDFPPPTPMGLGEVDGYDLPTISDVISLYDYQYNSGAIPICPNIFNKYQPNQSSLYIVNYDDMFPANASSMTLHINLNSITNIRGLTLPLEILVNDTVPGLISCDFGDYWYSLFDNRSIPFQSEYGQLRYGGFSSASSGVASGDGQLLTVDLYVESTSSEPRPITVQFGQYQFPYVKSDYVNYPMVVQQSAPGALTAWEPLLSGCGGFCENTFPGDNVTVDLSPEIDVTFGNIAAEGTTEFSVNTCIPEEDPNPEGAIALGGTYYCITTSATSTGDIEICITYDDTQLPIAEGLLELHHWNGADWDLITSSHDVDNNVICGITTFLSPFILSHPFICGDANNDATINILDITYLINYLYKGGPSPDPLEAADVNADAAVNILDITYLINYLYKGGPDPTCS